MIDWMLTTVGLGAGLVGLAAGRIWGAHVTERRAARELDDQRFAAQRELAARVKAMQHLEARLEKLSAEAAISLSESRPTTPPPTRATVRALERFVGRLRGLASVDEAVVILPDGLPATRCDDEALLRAGALVGELARADGALGGFIGLSVEVRRADPLSFRRLPPWTGGAWLVARGRGGPVNGLALDAAIVGAYAEQRYTTPPARLSGATHADPGPVAAILGGELRDGVFGGVALIDASGLVACAAVDGPDRALVERLALDLLHVGARAAHWCGDVVGLRLANALGEWVALAPGAGGAMVAAFGAGHAVDELALERIRGRLRRRAPAPSTQELAS